MEFWQIHTIMGRNGSGKSTFAKVNFCYRSLVFSIVSCFKDLR